MFDFVNPSFSTTPKPTPAPTPKAAPNPVSRSQPVAPTPASPAHSAWDRSSVVQPASTLHGEVVTNLAYPGFVSSPGDVKTLRSKESRGMFPTFETRNIGLSDFNFVPHTQPDLIGDKNNKYAFRGTIELGGESFKPTRRFWHSLALFLNVQEKMFLYFTPNELISRIVQKKNDPKFRLTIERAPRSGPKLLSLSQQSRPMIDFDSAYELLQRYQVESTFYSEGVLMCSSKPRSGSSNLPIGPDLFRNQFTMSVPVDGLGDAKLHLGLLRLICLNGMVGMTNAFTSAVRMGKEPQHVLERALSTFDNEEGFSVLRDRFAASQRSWASLAEVQRLHSFIMKLPKTESSAPVLNRFQSLIDDCSARYGFANLSALTERRLRVLPATMRAYDLINIATEISTHHVSTPASLRVNSWSSDYISREFDLEDTAPELVEFKPLFFSTQRN